MKYPKYNVNEYIGGYFEYITPCPFGIQGRYTNEALMVGSLACQTMEIVKQKGRLRSVDKTSARPYPVVKLHQQVVYSLQFLAYLHHINVVYTASHQSRK